MRVVQNEVKGPAQPIVPPSQSCHPRRAANQNARSYHAERLPLCTTAPKFRRVQKIRRERGIR